jgi:hypothetical protein
VKLGFRVGFAALAALISPAALVSHPFPAPVKPAPSAIRRQIKVTAPEGGCRHGGYKSAYKCAKAKGKNGRGFKRRLLGWS